MLKLKKWRGNEKIYLLVIWHTGQRPRNTGNAGTMAGTVSRRNAQAERHGAPHPAKADGFAGWDVAGFEEGITKI